MYLLSQRIKAQGFKVVLSGEGADEAYGGYLYFHHAPSPTEFHQCAHALPILRLVGLSSARTQLHYKNALIFHDSVFVEAAKHPSYALIVGK